MSEQKRPPGRPRLPSYDYAVMGFLLSRGRSYAHVAKVLDTNPGTVWHCMNKRRAAEREQQQRELAQLASQPW